MILRHLGREAEAAQIMRNYHRSRTDHPAHQRFVRAVAAKLQIEGLPEL